MLRLVFSEDEFTSDYLPMSSFLSASAVGWLCSGYASVVSVPLHFPEFFLSAFQCTLSWLLVCFSRVSARPACLPCQSYFRRLVQILHFIKLKFSHFDTCFQERANLPINELFSNSHMKVCQIALYIEMFLKDNNLELFSHLKRWKICPSVLQTSSDFTQRFWLFLSG